MIVVVGALLFLACAVGIVMLAYRSWKADREAYIKSCEEIIQEMARNR